MTTIISKETINRLLKDVKQIIKSPLTENGIYYIHDDTDMLKGYAMIVGPSDTPYFGGYYFFELCYPVDYPHSPPKVKYCTNGDSIRFNPNLYTCGKVCVSLLNTWRGDQWTSCQTISTVLLTLCSLLCNDPLLNEPGVNKTLNSVDIKNYNEIITYANLDVAVCNIVRKKKGVYQDFFNSFESFIKENFLKNYDAFLEFSKTKNSNMKGNVTNITTQYYCLNITIDYNKVIEKLELCKALLE
jgi:ubiquitin-conjugating enzyme E2 Z